MGLPAAAGRPVTPREGLCWRCLTVRRISLWGLCAACRHLVTAGELVARRIVGAAEEPESQ